LKYPRSLYGGGPPHVHTDTSLAAAVAIECQSRALRGRVYRLIRDATASLAWEGRTDEQVQLALGMRVQTETARRRELVLLGLVEDSGRRRLLSSGRQGIVWVAAKPAEHQTVLGL
jgi:hypothetical protein